MTRLAKVTAFLSALTLSGIAKGDVLVSNEIIRPIEELSPVQPILIEAMDLINRGDLDQAASKLMAFKPSNDLDTGWVSYLSGIIAFGRQDYSGGMTLLQTPYTSLKGEPSRYDSNYHRLVAKCLKKVGWNFRRLKEYEKAYTNHSVVYQIYERYGAFAELHDAAISLDVDSFFLGDMELDEYWLGKSIEAGDRIPEGKRKSAALGTSYNNLAGTLYGLVRFENSEQSIKRSFDYWSSYEEVAGTSENKLVWAYFGIGDVYQTWAQHLRDKRDVSACEAKKAQASNAYNQALQLSVVRAMNDDDISSIKSRVDEVAAISCQ